MWVVCAKCGRWNLTPLEERWEAIEDCEKQYRATFTRSSTDQIGLGRVKEGTDLIRIGQPLRPEFAAWRYGRHFQRRRRQTQLLYVAGIGSYAAAAAFGGPITLVPGVAGILFGLASRKSEIGRAHNFIKQRAEAGLARKIRRAEEVGLRIISTDDDQGWGLRFAHEETERAAVEGELQRLEDDWREAEEIAAIADNLFLPKAVTDFIDRHRPAKA